MVVQCAATKLMMAKPNSTAPRIAKIPAAPKADWREARSDLMALAPVSLTQPAACQRARSRSTRWLYQDMGLPCFPAFALGIFMRRARRIYDAAVLFDVA